MTDDDDFEFCYVTTRRRYRLVVGVLRIVMEDAEVEKTRDLALAIHDLLGRPESEQ